MIKYVKVLETQECDYFVIGDETLRYVKDQIVDVSAKNQKDIANLMGKFLEEVSEEEAQEYFASKQ